jgi:23S rRNA (cytidine1920-2'-O)/16S rRNA (cytidine1409-2'-O)-methyltransferase
VRRRLDIEMVRRGIAASRTEAQIAIGRGHVTVAGRLAGKASTLVAPEESISVARPARRFVSRGGDKLDAALERFGLRVDGLLGLDAGASTGGFTHALLTRGAARVVALDVGYGQLDWRLREDPRVEVMERTNVRDLQPAALPIRPEIVTADLSFISLRAALPALIRCAAPDAAFVLLVKPQFEAGRQAVGAGGVVADPEAWRSAVRSVWEACIDEGLEPLAAMASPLTGPAGNVEFLLYARRGATRAHDDAGREAVIDAAVAEGLAVRAGLRPEASDG